MTRATAETVRLCLRAEAAVIPVYVPEAAPERVLVLSAWYAGALHRDRNPLLALELGVRAQVRAKRRPSSMEEDPSTTQIHVREELPCRHHQHNEEQLGTLPTLRELQMGFLPSLLWGMWAEFLPSESLPRMVMFRWRSYLTTPRMPEPNL